MCQIEVGVTSRIKVSVWELPECGGVGALEILLFFCGCYWSVSPICFRQIYIYVHMYTDNHVYNFNEIRIWPMFVWVQNFLNWAIWWIFIKQIGKKVVNKSRKKHTFTWNASNSDNAGTILQKLHILRICNVNGHWLSEYSAI